MLGRGKWSRNVILRVVGMRQGTQGVYGCSTSTSDAGERKKSGWRLLGEGYGRRRFESEERSSGMRQSGWWIFLQDTFAGIVIMFWITNNVFSLCEVSGKSMQPTLNPYVRSTLAPLLPERIWPAMSMTTASSPLFNDRVIADRWSIRSGDGARTSVSRGDVVVLRAPDAPITLVKRVLAVEGDTIRIPRTGLLETIPPGHCWIEGDNALCSH